ncbi:MAG: hypothetical protein J0J15_08165 [Mesorhizobium sp.]|nr:hypothetical protein [Mesorhizobium sp.]
MSALTRFLGDSPLRILVKLLVVSFIVGLVMNAFGWSPLDVWRCRSRSPWTASPTV